MAAFVTLCEGFLGVEPWLDLWCRLFYLKRQTVKDPATGQKVMTACGAAQIHFWAGAGFPQLPLQDSVKN